MGAHRIAVIGGDGVGPEVIEAGCSVLESLAEVERRLTFSFQCFDWGSDYYRRHERMMPEDGLAQLRPFDAIYFGAVGDPHLPDDGDRAGEQACQDGLGDHGEGWALQGTRRAGGVNKITPAIGVM